MKKIAMGAALKTFGVIAYVIFVFVLMTLVGGKKEAAPEWAAYTLFFIFACPAVAFLAYVFLYYTPKEIYTYFKEKAIKKLSESNGPNSQTK
jgi:NADH:ubiquinone oxidoreductase subunit 6 (subunit J)